MKISKAGLDLIKSFEGYHVARADGTCESYQCPAGVWTIGWGTTEGITKGLVWSRDEAEFALRRDIARFERGVAEMVKVDPTQAQFDALVSFAYNCGLGALRKSTILARYNAGDIAGAAAAFGMWTRAAGTVLPGLVRRRQKEAALFLSSVDPTDTAMPQAVTVDTPATKPLATSGTVWGTLAGGIAAIGTFAEQTLASLIEWASKLTEMAPVQSALANVSGNVKSVTLGLGIGAAVYVISRRIKAAQEGKPG